MPYTSLETKNPDGSRTYTVRNAGNSVVVATVAQGGKRVASPLIGPNLEPTRAMAVATALVKAARFAAKNRSDPIMAEVEELRRTLLGANPE